MPTVDDCHHCDEVSFRDIAVDDPVRRNYHLAVRATGAFRNYAAAFRELCQPLRRCTNALCLERRVAG